MQKLFKIFALSLVISLVGCAATNQSASAPTSTRVINTLYGTVESVGLAKTEPTSTGTAGGIGAVAGAVIGAVLGGQRGGGGWLQFAAGVAGSVIGGLTANEAEKALSVKDQQEIVVRLSSDLTIRVVQPIDDAVMFANGDKVRVLTNAAGVTRVEQI
ncbi:MULTISPECIES: hypothetical protein [Herbaspirillum]|uniref:Glycine zipper 2TM domain-containing protein n=2 Tax=Herbaspirillum huttiense TaxID=863372 RepID=A0AAJ2HAR8_9BURK|nr:MULTISPECIES: hypothetical protein [Herbaspirillum]MDR9837036.1 hypothetical protein [Herbaspirillum huttiense]